MKKLALLTTTAIVAATLAMATPVQAAEQEGWFDSMKSKVQTWFKQDGQGGNAVNAEVEAYLDQITVAVPPMMTGEEAAAIQPAAGDYVEEVEGNAGFVGTQQPEIDVPGSIQGYRKSEFNTEMPGEGSVTAFGDLPTADDLAGIMPAAGDAVEITDESVVVVETPAVTETVTETIVETPEAVVTEVETTTEILTEEGVVTETTVDTTVEETTTDAETGAVAE